MCSPTVCDPSGAILLLCPVLLFAELTAGILWSFPLIIQFDLGGLVSYTLICMLATAMLSSFMMLALSVSGTGSSCMLLFALFTVFVRVIAAIFLGCMAEITLLPINDMWQSSFFSPIWFLPVNIFWYILEMDIASPVMYSLPNILYSILSTLAVYALAGLIYKHRKSEMAGNPAPGRKTQALFRIMFTLLPALLVPLFLANSEDDAALHLVLVVCILLVYFLYELITTKRPQNMLKSIPGLGIVMLCCLTFSAVFLTYQRVVLLESISAEEIETVSIKAGGMDEYTYQGILLDNFQTDDSEIIQVIADQLAYTQDVERTRIYPDHGSWSRVVVTIRLDNGRTLTRRIMLESEASMQIHRKLISLEETQELLYRLPEFDELYSAGLDIDFSSGFVDYHHFYTDDTLKGLMDVFRDEFKTLTSEQRDAVMEPTFNYPAWARKDTQLTLNLSGNRSGKHFDNLYVITTDLPITRAHLLSLCSEDPNNYYNGGNMDWSGTSLDILRQFLVDMEDESFFRQVGSVSVDLYAGKINGGDGLKANEFSNIEIEAEKLPELIALLAERDLLNTKEETQIEEKPGRYNASKPLTITEDTYILRIMLEGLGEPEFEDYYEEDYKTESVWKDSHFYMEVTGFFDLTAEDWETIQNLLAKENSKYN